MKNLTEIYADFEAALDGIGADCKFEPIERLTKTLEMDVENDSDGFHTSYVYSLERDGQKLELHYILAPVDEGMPTSHSFQLRLSDDDTVTKYRDWHIEGGSLPLGYSFNDTGELVTP